MTNKPITFGIIGNGWRAAFYHQIASKLPHLFKVSGVYLRDPLRRKELEAQWQVPLFEDVEKLAAQSDFVVLAISKPAATAWLHKLAALNIPVLAETPAVANADEVEDLLALAERQPAIQVAEQYPFQPHHAARSAYIESGQLGEITHVEVSAAHGYHGISLIRKWLGIDSATCEIIARRSEKPIVDFAIRGHEPSDYSQIRQERQEVAILSFPHAKSAVLSFSGAQYFSPIRRSRVLIRGTHGEIYHNSIVHQLPDGEVEELNIKRIQGGIEGSLAPFSLRTIRAGQSCLYQNPFFPIAMSDEEIAIAHTLQQMAAFVQDGTSFYSLSEALLDARLSLAMDEAIASGSSVTLD